MFLNYDAPPKCTPEERKAAEERGVLAREALEAAWQDALTHKVCSRCQQQKNISEFAVSGGYRAKCCRDCLKSKRLVKNQRREQANESG